jgi:hypothetical protein
MEEVPCKNCLLLAICKNKYNYFVLENLYSECYMLRIYLSHDDKIRLSSIFNLTADKKTLVARLNSIKKYIPKTGSWIVQFHSLKYGSA